MSALHFQFGVPWGNAEELVAAYMKGADLK